VALLVLNILPELIMQMGDRGIAVPPYTRPLAYYLGAFQPDLLTSSGSVYFGQSLLMFFTYGFLHTGFVHFGINILGLIWLGPIILSYRTSETFLIVYLMSMVGAAEVFALIGSQEGGLAGASGALFGLLGVYAVDHRVLIPAKSRNSTGFQITWLILTTSTLVLGDLLSQRLFGTSVGWQAHAGGFLTGAIIALVLPPRYAVAS
jgi:membrane associated rhomboid family serine protease